MDRLEPVRCWYLTLVWKLGTLVPVSENQTSNLPTTCPFAAPGAERVMVRVLSTVKTRRGHVIADRGHHAAWLNDEGSYTLWTPEHYAGCEWSSVKPGRIAVVS